MVAAMPTALYELAELAAFRVYVTDALYAMGNDKRLVERYTDLVKPRVNYTEQDARDIANDVIARSGLTLVSEGKE